MSRPSEAAHRGSAKIRATPEQIWAVINDPAALGRVLPGVESLVAEGDGRFRGVLATRTSFMTVRADMTAALLDLDPPHAMRLELTGRARGIGGEFVVSVPMLLEPEPHDAAPEPPDAEPEPHDAAPEPSDAEPEPSDAEPEPLTRLDYELEISLTGTLASLGATMMRRSIEGLVTQLIANLESEAADRAG